VSCGACQGLAHCAFFLFAVRSLVFVCTHFHPYQRFSTQEGVESHSSLLAPFLVWTKLIVNNLSFLRLQLRKRVFVATRIRA
jgi:hypothetical protein